MEKGNLDTKEFNEMLVLEYNMKWNLSTDKKKDTKRLKELKDKKDK